MQQSESDQLAADAAALALAWGVAPSTEAVASERRKRNAERKLRSVVTRSPAPVLGGPKAVKPVSPRAASLPMRQAWAGHTVVYNADRTVAGCVLDITDLWHERLELLIDFEVARAYGESTENWALLMNEKTLTLRNSDKYRDVSLAVAVVAHFSSAAFKKNLKKLAVSNPRVDDVGRVDFRMQSLAIRMAGESSDDFKIGRDRAQLIGQNDFVFDLEQARAACVVQTNASRKWAAYQKQLLIDAAVMRLLDRWYRLWERHRTGICIEWESFNMFRADMERPLTFGGLGLPDKPQQRLLRKDASLSFSAQNCFWGGQKEAYALRKAEKGGTHAN
ncbi:MAG: hypothetical protein WBQ39_07755 [Terriglobales bacterium]